MNASPKELLICERLGCGHNQTRHGNDRDVCRDCACPYFSARLFPCEECGLTLSCLGEARCPREAKCPSCDTTNECPNHEVD